MTENDLYRRASNIIIAGMGHGYVSNGLRRKKVRMAEEDPLAFWCGVEAIVKLAEDWKRVQSQGGE